ncbi:MAG: DUF1552 domain-containing protein [Gemmataceae bacterium]
MPSRSAINRRRFLRGLGAAVALPAFESLRPVAHAAPTAPVRMAFLYFPNGAIPSTWWPTGEGKDFQLNRTMEPLEPVKHRIQVIAGLDHQNAYPGPDGPGDHARANGCFLTGVRVKKTAGADIRAGVSIDQVAAQKIGHLTRFPSLELSCDAVRKSGSCDSGYSCAYEYNLAWRSPTVPLSPEPNPRLVFERLFGSGAKGERGASFERRREQQRSVLDFVLEDAKSLNADLGGRDKQKLDEYLTSVREIERRIAAAEQFGTVPDPDTETPTGIPPKFEDHMRLMYSLLLLAFQTDSTRIATMLLAHDGDNRPYPDLNIPEGHHYLTHHGNRKEMIEKVKDIDLFYARQFAWFLGELEKAKDADGQSILHNSMIVYGCANSDGNRHTHSNLPVILAGGGGGRLTPGRYNKLKSTPMCNLFLSMLDRLGVEGVTHFGDSTGRVEGV